MNQQFSPLPLLFFCLLTIMSCADKEAKENIKAFYFPIDKLQNGSVYEYRSVHDPKLPPEYWYYKSYESDTGTYFTGNFYNEDFIVQQFCTEEVVSNGTLLHSYFLYASDTAGVASPKCQQISLCQMYIHFT